MKRFALTSLIIMLAVAAMARPAAAERYTDELGRIIEVPEHPQRIIALTPALTETLFALGLGGKTVGATTWADYPPQAAELPRVGSYVSINLERILELAPDLVLASREGNPPQAVETLQRMGIPVYVIAPNNPLNLPETMTTLGEVCGAPAAGRRLAGQIKRQFDEVRKKVAGAPRPATLIVIGSNPLITAGEGSLNNALLNMAGAKNIAQGIPGRWPKLSMEKVVEAQPRIVIISTMERGMERDKVLEHWRNMPGLAGRPGYRVAYIESSIVDRPGPRLGQGLLELARLVHPELFDGEKQ